MLIDVISTAGHQKRLKYCGDYLLLSPLVSLKTVLRCVRWILSLSTCFFRDVPTAVKRKQSQEALKIYVINIIGKSPSKFLEWFVFPALQRPLSAVELYLEWPSQTPRRSAGCRLDAWHLKHFSFAAVFLKWTCKSYWAAGRATLWAISLSPSFRSNYCNTCSLSVCVLSVQAENSALSLENDNQRKQYERCLDEVSVKCHVE